MHEWTDRIIKRPDDVAAPFSPGGWVGRCVHLKKNKKNKYILIKYV